MLSLENVKKSFVEPGGGRLPILDVRRFQVVAGEQMVLIGRSGSGKTTLLHLIAGISRPDEGIIRIDGIDIVRLPEAGCDRFRADKLGYVFQTFNLLQGFTALENVLLGMSFATGRAKPERRTAVVGSRRLGASAPSQAVTTFRRRATASSCGASIGESTQATVGRRTNREHRHAASAAGDRSDPRNLPRRERGAGVSDAHVGSGEAV